MSDDKKEWLDGFPEEMDEATARRIRAIHG